MLKIYVHGNAARLLQNNQGKRKILFVIDVGCFCGQLKFSTKSNLG